MKKQHAVNIGWIWPFDCTQHSIAGAFDSRFMCARSVPRQFVCVGHLVLITARIDTHSQHSPTSAHIHFSARRARGRAMTAPGVRALERRPRSNFGLAFVQHLSEMAMYLQFAN